MVDRPIDLSYGHTGEAIYDSNSQTWRFGRSLGHNTARLRNLDTTTDILPPSAHHVDNELTARERNLEIRRLARSYPDLAPAVDIAVEFSKESEASVKILIDRLESPLDLLATGYLIHQDDPTHRVQIIAAASGENGNAVRLLQHGDKIRDAGGELANKHSQRHPYVLRKNTWICSEHSITQLLFSRPTSDNGIFLAVLTNLEVKVLHVQIQRRSSQGFQLDEVLAVAEVGARGLQPVSMVFNPEDPTQLFMLCQDGNWSIVGLGNRKVNGLQYIAQLMGKGRISSLPPKEQVDEDFRMKNIQSSCVWVAQPESLVLATRRSCYFLPLNPLGPSIDVSQKVLVDAGEMIVDIKPTPDPYGHLLLLTNRRLMLLRIRGRQEAPVDILLSWRHYQDPDDLSLRLDKCEVPEEHLFVEENESIGPSRSGVLLVAVYSRHTGMITIYSFAKDEALPNLIVSVQDPYLLDLNIKNRQRQGRNKTNAESGYISTHEKSLITIKIDSSTGRIQSSEDGSQNFHRLTLRVLFENLSLSGYYLGTSSDLDESATAEDAGLAENPMDIVDNVSDDFILQDQIMQNDGGAALPGMYTNLEYPYDESDDSGTGNSLVADYRWLVQGLDNQALETATNSQDPLQALVRLIYHAKTDLQDESPVNGVQTPTIFEVSGANPQIDDIDVLSRRLETLLSSDVMQRWHVSHLIKTIPQVSKGSLLAFYEQMLSDWIRPLSDEVPNPTKVIIAKKMQQVAVEVFLASRSVKPFLSNRTPSSPADLESSQSNKSFNLPIHMKGVPQNWQERGSQKGHLIKQSQEENVSPKLRPSQIVKGVTTDTKELEHPALTRLRDFIAFDTKIISYPLLPILQKWQTGESLDGYDWARTSLVGAQSADSEQVTTKKSHNKQRPQVGWEAKQSSGPSSQPTLKRSDQTFYHKPPPSSQISDAMMTMTQPEAGAHGSRKPDKKHKKPRKPGFR